MQLSSSQLPLPSSQLKGQARSVGSFRQFLLMSSAIAISAGVGFGAAIRCHLPEQPGSTILHQEQSFPPRQDWPVSQSSR